jgi:hypothetical protein
MQHTPEWISHAVLPSVPHDLPHEVQHVTGLASYLPPDHVASLEAHRVLTWIKAKLRMKAQTDLEVLMALLDELVVFVLACPPFLVNPMSNAYPRGRHINVDLLFKSAVFPVPTERAVILLEHIAGVFTYYMTAGMSCPNLHEAFTLTGNRPVLHHLAYENGPTHTSIDQFLQMDDVHATDYHRHIGIRVNCDPPLFMDPPTIWHFPQFHPPGHPIVGNLDLDQVYEVERSVNQLLSRFLWDWDFSSTTPPNCCTLSLPILCINRATVYPVAEIIVMLRCCTDIECALIYAFHLLDVFEPHIRRDDLFTHRSYDDDDGRLLETVIMSFESVHPAPPIKLGDMSHISDVIVPHILTHSQLHRVYLHFKGYKN